MDTDVQATENRIFTLIHELPPERLPVVEQFIRALKEQLEEGHPPYKYPTVRVPASVLLELDSILSPIGGDALADSEALYDDV